jgi:hypothetical protein
MKGRGSGKDWLLIKGQDSFAKKDWEVKQELTPAKKKKLVEKIPPCETSEPLRGKHQTPNTKSQTISNDASSIMKCNT